MSDPTWENMEQVILKGAEKNHKDTNSIQRTLNFLRDMPNFQNYSHKVKLRLKSILESISRAPRS